MIKGRVICERQASCDHVGVEGLCALFDGFERPDVTQPERRAGLDIQGLEAVQRVAAQADGGDMGLRAVFLGGWIVLGEGVDPADCQQFVLGRD